jgi:hypothetical protein
VLQSSAFGTASCVPGIEDALFQGANVGTLSIPSGSCEVSYRTCFVGELVLRLDATLTSPGASGEDNVLTFAAEEAKLSGKLCGS